MLVLLRLYRGCSESLYPIIFLFMTVNSLSRYKSAFWGAFSVLGKEVPRSLYFLGTSKYVSRELLRGIRLKLHKIKGNY